MVIEMVRAYILTEREREILKRFVETGEKMNGFSVLIHYLRKYKNSLKEDLDLIELAIRRAEGIN